MFQCKQIYVCALFGVLIKWLYEMRGATMKIWERGSADLVSGPFRQKGWETVMYLQMERYDQPGPCGLDPVQGFVHRQAVICTVMIIGGFGRRQGNFFFDYLSYNDLFKMHRAA